MTWTPPVFSPAVVWQDEPSVATPLDAQQLNLEATSEAAYSATIGTSVISYFESGSSPTLGALTYRQVAANYPMVATDRIVGITDTSVSRTITLCLSSGLVPGTLVIVKDESGGAGSNAITILAAGTDAIDGLVSVQITGNYGSVLMYAYSNGYATMPGAIGSSTPPLLAGPIAVSPAPVIT